MRHILFLASWIGTGATLQDAQRCAAIDLWHANGIAWSNLRDTGQQNVLPDPNVCTFEAWVTDAGVSLLEASPDYFVLLNEAA